MRFNPAPGKEKGAQNSALDSAYGRASEGGAPGADHSPPMFGLAQPDGVMVKTSEDPRIAELSELVEYFNAAPAFEEMPRRSLSDKAIAGPTAAHVIEEVHVPLNLAYLTFTTGSTSFQNIVGVAHSEIPARIAAAQKALALAGVERGAHVVVSYPPLVNVFSAAALEGHGLSWSFPRRSSRDALILSLIRERPSALIGESRFLRAACVDAERLGYASMLPRDLIVLCSGTTLDLDFIEVAAKYGWRLHDLYGCQEFGWLALDGVELRSDLTLAPSPVGPQYREVVVGGLPMADSCPLSPSGHVLNHQGGLITYRRQRTSPEYEVMVMATTLLSQGALEKVSRTILRLKSRIVKLAPEVAYGAPATRLRLVPSGFRESAERKEPIEIEGPEKTLFFDLMVQAQKEYQENSKTDPAWNKGGH
jgi:hypothetical protein